MRHILKLNRSMLPFWVVTLALVFGLTLPVLIQDAMFQDGVLYSSVAHNLSIGFGNFWFPQYSTLNIEGITSFHEQPPLFFGILALFYKVFGASIYVERFFVFLMLLLHLFLLNRFWKIINQNTAVFSSMGWMPILFWILTPICFWSFRHNMIENTVSVFTLGSILLVYNDIRREKIRIGLWLLSGLLIFAASFAKGVPALFTLTFPFIYWLVTRKITFKKAVIFTMLLFSVPVIIYSIILLFPESRESLRIYFFQRLVGRVSSMPGAEYRLETAWRLVLELLPAIIISLLVMMFVKKVRHKEFLEDSKKPFLIFFLLGLSGSLPLTLTMVQKGFYLVPSLSFFALAFSVLLAPYVKEYAKNINVLGSRFKIFQVIAILLFCTSLFLTVGHYGKISRHEEMVTDVYKIGSVVPRFSTIQVPEKMYDQYDFKLQGFLVRYFNISISPYMEYEYFLTEKNASIPVPDAFQLKVDLDLIKYNLYQRVD